VKVQIVYESMYGNTHAIADAIAEGAQAGGAEVVVQPVSEGDGGADGADMLIVGGPTHMHGLTTGTSRKMAAEAAKEDEHPLDPSGAGPGLRTWLKALGHVDGTAAAAFDTRGDAASALTGSAARGIARRLRHHGYKVADRASFLVDDSEGPLADGELERARDWGRGLVSAA
jgi:hypothetical protein